MIQLSWHSDILTRQILVEVFGMRYEVRGIRDNNFEFYIHHGITYLKIVNFGIDYFQPNE